MEKETTINDLDYRVENAVPENQYIEKYMNILIAQIIKFKLLDITFIIFKYCIGVLIYSYLKVCF